MLRAAAGLGKTLPSINVATWVSFPESNGIGRVSAAGLVSFGIRNAYTNSSKLGLLASLVGAIHGRPTMRRPTGVPESTAIGAAIAAIGAIGFRLPELLNPGVVNSDSAVVGLQGMHILRGEWHWFLWGSGYQTTADPAVAALLFALCGATPLVLMATALVGHLLAVLFTYLTLSRHLTTWQALLLVVPLIASSAPTHTYTLHPPRQTAITLVFAAIWLLDGSAKCRRPLLQFALGAGVATLSWFSDPYALVFAPALAILTLLCAWDGQPSRAILSRRLTSAAGGALIGAIPFVMCRLTPYATSGPLSFSRALLFHNWTLLKESCLPWVLGTRVLHQPMGAPDYIAWHPSLPFHAIQWLGALVFAATACVSLVSIGRRQLPWELRRLGFASAIVVFTTLAGFLVSVMPMDHYASRYLVSLVLVVPFLAAWVARVVSTLTVALVLAPMWASFAVCGWLGYEPLVRGVQIVDAGLSRDEAQLLRELAKRGVTHAMADYWAAYRLTFIFNEKVIVVPVHESQDRYAPYRRSFFEASRYAYIFDHKRSEESQRTVQRRVQHGQDEKFTVGVFDVYIINRENSTPPELVGSL